MNQPLRTVVVPSQPARLQIGDREILVPTEAMSHESRNRRQVELLLDSPDCFILSPLPGPRWIGWLLGLLLVTVVCFLWVLGGKAIANGGWWGIALLGISVPFVALLFLMGRNTIYGKGPPRFQFDRGQGRLTVDHRLGLSKNYQTGSIRPLNEIAAIQLLYSGYHAIVHTSDSGPSTSERFHTYEMNLLLEDSQQSRLHLCTHGDWQWMREAGQKLAEFLGAPIVDQLHHGP
jgi:hypothetical protein